MLSWPPAGPPRRPFLLVHGLSSNALLWQQTAEILSESGHPCFAVDLRSHGLSDAPDSGYTTATATDDVAAVASALGLSQVLAVGQSFGGNVVIDLAARHPELIAGIGLVDGGLFNPSMVLPSREAWLTAATPPDVDGSDASAMRARLRDAHPDWSDRAIEATMGNVAIDPAGRVKRRLSVPHHMQLAADMWDAPPAKQYGHVRVPVMLMPAIGPGQPPISRAEEAATLFPQARVHAHEGVHDLHAQQPEAIANDLLELAAWVQ